MTHQDDANGKPKVKPPQNIITEEDIRNAEALDGEGSARNPAFGRTIDFLIYLGAFGNSKFTKKEAEQAAVAMLYGEPGRDEITSHGQSRLTRQRYGRAAFTEAEASFWHDAFRATCGDDWANAIKPHEFVRGDINKVVPRMIAAGLPAPWDDLDPVAALRMMALSCLDDTPVRMVFNRYGKRFTEQFGGEPEHFGYADDMEEFAPETEYRVVLDGLGDDQTFLAIEYSAYPRRSDHSNEILQGQIMRFTGQNGPRGYVTAEGNKYLKIGRTPGELGYCVIVHPAGFDPVEAFGLQDAGDKLSVEEMRAFAKAVRTEMFANPAIKLAMLDYRIVA